MTGNQEEPKKNWTGHKIAAGIQDLFGYLFSEAKEDSTRDEDSWFRDLFRKEDEDGKER